MELWIRSQDKERLCKPNNLFIKNNAICCSYNDENNDYDYLGVYSTKERVLEVLDEIQENIVKQGQVIILTDERGIPNGSKFFSYVYEMPKE